MSVAGAEPVLQVAIASKWYRPARAEAVEAVRNLTFGVGAGEIVCLIGPSGAGKTTTLRILLGLDTAFEGRVSGADRAGIVFQEPRLLPWRSVEHNVRLGLPRARRGRDLDDLFDAAGTADGNLLVSINNPYLSTADRATIAANLAPGQQQFYVGRALSDLTTGRSQATVETYRFVAGFDGALDVAGRNFKWEVSGVYGRSQTTGRNYELVQQNFANAIDAVRDASGNITCRPGAVNANIATLSSTCAPLNIFGVGQSSQAARDYIFAIATPRSVNEQYVFNANINGPVFTLFGNDVSISAGY